MRTLLRTALGLTAAAATAALLATPAAAAPAAPESGLTFYQGSFGAPLLNVADPNGSCTAFPATSGSLIGWSNVEHVLGYASGDCSGPGVGLGTLRTFAPGRFGSFTAS
jgi:hypothetical protein